MLLWSHTVLNTSPVYPQWYLSYHLLQQNNMSSCDQLYCCWQWKQRGEANNLPPSWPFLKRETFRPTSQSTYCTIATEAQPQAVTHLQRQLFTLRVFIFRQKRSLGMVDSSSLWQCQHRTKPSTIQTMSNTFLAKQTPFTALLRLNISMQ